jgi:riboflavin transporter FmnP
MREEHANMFFNYKVLNDNSFRTYFLWGCIMSQLTQKRTNYIVKIAILGALARVVMLLEFPLPIFPGFLKFDFSDLVPLIGSLALGPVAGIMIEFVKCLLHTLTGGLASTGGVGDLANFIVGAAYVFAAGSYYKNNKTKKGAVIGLALGTIAMIISGGIVNYFITIPLYAIVLGFATKDIINMSAAVIPAINSKLTLILYAFCPFNLLKGLVLTLIAIPLYKKVSPLLHKEIL